MTTSGRLLLLNIGNPSRLLSIPSAGGAIEVLVSDLGVAPDGLATDPICRRIFWTCMGSKRDGEDFPANDGYIESINLEGGDRSMVVAVGQTFTPKQIQCDPVRGLIYWCDREGMRVMRARTDGSAITVLVQTGTSDEDRLDRRRHCVGVAVDPVGGYLYWTQKGKPNGNEGRILRAALDLPPGVDPANRTDVVTLLDNLPEPIDLDWEDRDGRLYWTDRGDSPTGNTLNRVSLRHGEPGTPEILLTGLQEGMGLSLDRERRLAFLGDLSGTVPMISLDATADVTVVFSGQGPLTGIAYHSIEPSVDPRS